MPIPGISLPEKSQKECGLIFSCECENISKCLKLKRPRLRSFSIDPFPKRHRLVHNGEFPKVRSTVL